MSAKLGSKNTPNSEPMKDQFKPGDRADVHEMIAEFAPEAIYSFFSDAEFTTFKLIK